MVIILIILIKIHASAQNKFPSSGAAGIGTTSPNSSSLLEIKSTTKGLLIPRLTQTQRNAISAPVTGLLIYQTDNYPGFYYYDGNAWNIIGYWKKNGTSVFFNTGNVGFGTLSPAYKIDVKGGDINISAGNKYRIGGVKVFSDDPPNQNLFIGDNADSALNGGYNNTAVGPLALGNNKNGNYNSALGANSLRVNISGSSNVAVGEKSLYNNTTGTYNTALGSGALYSNTTTGSNIAIGYQSLYKNIANENVAIGFRSLYNNTSAADNAAVGYEALYSNTTGAANVAIGVQSLYSNTTASNNTAIGYQSQYANTTGTANTSIGWASLNINTSGYNNTALGFGALENNVSGAYNTAVGSTALLHNTGTSNTAVGEKAMQSNTSGGSNSAFGSGALFTNTTSIANTALGFQSLYNTSSGGYNTAVGYQAGYSNTSGDLNLFLGEEAGFANTTGSFNSYGGYHAGIANTTGSFNTYYGYAAGISNTDGSQNTYVGYEAGLYSTGSNNTFLGYETSTTDATYSNSTAVGNGSSIVDDAAVILGNAATSLIESYASYFTFSDGRYKKNVKEDVAGLDFINKLRPVTYNLDVTGINKALNADEKLFTNNVVQNKEKKQYSGFIAQEVEKAANDLNYDFSGVKKPANSKSFYALSYADFVPPLVKAVQQLSKRNDSLQQTNASLQSQINELKAAVQTLANKQGIDVSSASINTSITSASLAQNVPNPYNHTTSIAYSLPAAFSSAQIVVINNLGKILKTISVSGSGKGVLHLDASTLAAGSYNYSLYVDGKLIDTKQMLLTK